MKYAICNEMFQGWAWADICRFAKEAGYDGIEIAPFTFSDDVRHIDAARREEIKKTAEDAGMPIVGIHWLLVKPEGFYVNHPDAALRRATADYLEALIDFCADLGGKIMVFGSPKQRNVHPDLSFTDARQYALDTFRLILPNLQSRNVTLCFEPLAPSETNFLNTADQSREFIEEINHPNFRMLLDVKAMSSEEKSIPDIIQENAHLLSHFHANDTNLLGPGFGEVDFAPIFTALKGVKYQGYVSVEVFDFTPGPEVIAKESLRYMKEKAG